MDVFISYAREDVNEAIRLNSVLEQIGFSVWRDLEALRAGEDFAIEIDGAISGVASVIVLWSDAASRSAWVRLEAEEARRQDKLVLVRIDDTPLPDELDAFHTENMSHWRGSLNDAAFRRIRQRLTELSGRHVIRRIQNFSESLAAWLSRSPEAPGEPLSPALRMLTGSKQIWELLGVRLDRFVLTPIVMAAFFSLMSLYDQDTIAKFFRYFFLYAIIMFGLRAINFISVPKIYRTTQMYFSREFALDCLVATVVAIPMAIIWASVEPEDGLLAVLQFFPLYFVFVLSVLEVLRGLLAFIGFLIKRVI